MNPNIDRRVLILLKPSSRNLSLLTTSTAIAAAPPATGFHQECRPLTVVAGPGASGASTKAAIRALICWCCSDWIGTRPSASAQCARAAAVSPAFAASSAMFASCCSFSRCTSVEQQGHASARAASSVPQRVHLRAGASGVRSSTPNSGQGRGSGANAIWARDLGLRCGGHPPCLLHPERNDGSADESTWQRTDDG